MNWNRYSQNLVSVPSVGITLDVSRVDFPDTFWEERESSIQSALATMTDLENGAIANPDEGRMVGHYWLRNPDLAPNEELRSDIRSTLDRIHETTAAVHNGSIRGAGGAFENLLVIGIGGSALGPQFVHQALGHPNTDKLKVFFFDNTDPDGIDTTLVSLRGQLDRTLCLVISKSGGTPETRNGMLEAKNAYERAGLSFAQHAIAVTGTDSKLDRVAVAEGWITRFPMWDWVGGRTSETGPVGLLPAALQGLDVNRFLAGAAAMDAATRSPDARKNPAAVLALMWHFLTNGKGEKDMVVLPYKDRLALFSKYLQQLVMESLGKEKDLAGNVVHQGIAVYGNKGSTDQHAYVQQLREGVPNFFAVFIQVLKDRSGTSIEVEEGTTSGDFLQGFYLGTREALSENGRPSLTLTVESVSAESVGALIALFERAVGLYASLVNINAYHQPGVEAGKKAATALLDLKKRVKQALAGKSGETTTTTEIAALAGADGAEEQVYQILLHRAANYPESLNRIAGDSPDNDTFQVG